MYPLKIYTKMCKFCFSILGNTKPHKETECALKQAAVCPHCGPGTHFLSDCPVSPKLISKKQKVLPSLQPYEPVNGIVLEHSNLGYIEYLKLYKQDYVSQIDKNRATVEAHLLKRGLILLNPIEPSKKTLSAKDTFCKTIHGGNEYCILKETEVISVPISKKKIVVKSK
jgi:hypothetical protein